jgi:L-Ala-D/L-Glu epimerase
MADVIVVTVTENGFTGRGEAVPYPRYNETVEQALAALKNARHEIEAGLSPELPKAAANALDCAIWDLRAKQTGKPAWALAHLNEPKSVITAFTLSLDTPETMARAALAAASRPLLKLKLGRNGDVERLHAIRQAVPHARLIVDANEGWTKATLPTMLAACEKYKVELVEQPLPADDDDALRDLPRSTLICADESAHGRKTLHELNGKYDAINIKLDKTGGLTEALALAHEAKSQDFKIMVGCMLATSLAMAPAFLLAQLADYVDLDGPLLLAKDRGPGFTFDGSLMLPPPRELWG